MPEYLFTREDDESVSCLLFYKMAEVPSVGASIIDENGVVWRRVFTKPNAAMATVIDPYSVTDFSKSFEGKNVNMGNMFDASREASEKRAAKEGVDPVKTKYLADYKKARKGTEHSVEKKERFDKTTADLGIKISNALRSGR